MSQLGLCTEEELRQLEAWTNGPEAAAPIIAEGDSLELMPLLPPSCVSLIVTSPPYPDAHRKPADWGRYRGEQFQGVHKAQMGGDDPDRLERTRRAPSGYMKLQKQRQRNAEDRRRLSDNGHRRRAAVAYARRHDMAPEDVTDKMLIAARGGRVPAYLQGQGEETEEARFKHGQPNAYGARGMAVHIHPDEWLDWFEPFAKEMCRLLKPRRALILNVGGVSFPAWHQHGFSYQIPAMMESLGFSLVREITWYKPNGKPVSAKDVMSEKTEKVWWFQKGKPGARPVWFPWELSTHGPDRVKVPVVGNVWEIPVGLTRWPEGQTHFACFPEELADRAIRGFSRPGELVLDPFCGSGTALIAARKLKRRSIGIELNPEGEIACAQARWEMEFGGEYNP